MSVFLDTHPVGSIFETVSSIDPNEVYGGTWEIFGAGRTLVGVDPDNQEFGTSELVGGAKTHTLTISEMPSHNHTQDSHRHTLGRDAGKYSTGSSRVSMQNYGASNRYYTTSSSQPAIQNTGGGQAHNNLQPYITCYMWLRTA